MALTDPAQGHLLQFAIQTIAVSPSQCPAVVHQKMEFFKNARVAALVDRHRPAHSPAPQSAPNVLSAARDGLRHNGEWPM